MGKRNKTKHRVHLMREWPVDESTCIPQEELLFPLKKIMHEGYRLNRLPISQFTYTGYNIGRTERAVYFPTPEERFSARWLGNEEKFSRTLLDNVLATAFQLGIEQGRRLSYDRNYSSKLLESLVYARTQKIKDLKAELSNYDNRFVEDPIVSYSSDADLIIEHMSDDVEA